MAKSVKMREAPWGAAVRRRLRKVQYEITGAKNSEGKDWRVVCRGALR
jgi:hypothetical protein